ncbi:MAG: hypothetical protein RBU37_15080 [Myxococcota bacterium]|jgi:hypothetical protein|nr:hypothetical protein [Myxococcota bacterium]
MMRKGHWHLFARAAIIASLTLSAAPLWAQDEAPAPEQSAPSKADPSDAIILHIDAMTLLVQQNMEKPEEAKKLIAAYIQEHSKEMKAAAEGFEAHLNSLSGAEAEKYKEGLQRKLEKSLEAFLAAMLEFSEKHPEAAKELDELLKTK